MDIVSPEHHQASGFTDHCRVSVPGRTEVAGNHQDHQGGCVIASAVDRRIVCDAYVDAGSRIRVRSYGHGECSINLADPNCWTSRASERNTTVSLVRGMAAQLMQQGVELQGCTLDIPFGYPSWGGAFQFGCLPELCVGAALAAIRWLAHHRAQGWRLNSRTTFARSALRPCIYLRWPCMPSGLSLASPVALWTKSPARLAASFSWISPIA